MRALGLVVVAAAVSGCIIEPPYDPTRDAGSSDAGLDAGQDAGRDAGGKDGGGGGYIYWDGGFVYWDGEYVHWDGGFAPWDGGSGGGGGGLDAGGGVDAGSGGGKDGGTPEPTASFPGSGQNGDPGTGVLWLVRIDRGTANLAASYATLIRGMTAQLAAEGFDVRVTGVASLYESRLYWSRSGKELSAPELQSMLESAANSSSGVAPKVCSTSALADMGNRLSWLSVSAPDSSTPSGGAPFASRLGALLVVMLDHGARPSAYGASDCGTGSMDPAGWFGGSRSATSWINGATSYWNLPRSQTRFLFVSTSETESYEQLRARCSAMSAFPRTALDAISPSPIVFYAPFAIGLDNYQDKLGTQQDLCDAVAGDWSSFSRGLAKDWASLLRLPEAQR